jgi:hypothetical protein
VWEVEEFSNCVARYTGRGGDGPVNIAASLASMSNYLAEIWTMTAMAVAAMASNESFSLDEPRVHHPAPELPNHLRIDKDAPGYLVRPLHILRIFLSETSVGIGDWADHGVL